MAVNSMPLTIGEILDKISAAKSKNERINILKENESVPLKHFLRLAFDPTIKMDLPEGRLPFTPNRKPKGFGNTNLKTALGPKSGFYVFFKKNTPNLRQAKRELMFTLLLEELDSSEAEYLLLAKDKKLDIGLTRKVLDETFPGLLSKEVLTNASDKEASNESNENKTESNS